MPRRTALEIVQPRAFIFFLLAIAVLLGIVTSANAQLKTVTAFRSTIEMERPAFRASQAITVRFHLTNTSGAALNVLKWQTPLEEFTAPIFQVHKDGVLVPYIGKLVKRGAPTADDYVSIAPGQTVSSTIDLAEGYAIADSGQYTVEFSSALLDFGDAAPSALAARKSLIPQLIRSNNVPFQVLEARKLPPTLPPGEGTAAKQPAFQSCSQTQQPVLSQALQDADTLTIGASLVLHAQQSNNAQCPRYKTWFGTYDATRWTTVTNHFDKLHDALANKTVTFHCDCNQGWYAYVYPNQPYHVWVCNAFWSAPANGTDSKAGTIVHETSHFNVVAQTQDHVYGQYGCKNLATNDPAKAIQNADSHEYFGENTPSQKCGVEQVPMSLLIIAVAAIGDRVRRRKLSKRAERR
ncbi:MAG TPA: M35 family metallo-endopeptidase [Terriglobales bacterium]|nr:M35 family metallo-endopeptidase [Terriglobales bacterium]